MTGKQEPFGDNFTKTTMEILGQQQAESNAIGGVLLNALYEAMPWGLEVDLPHGAKAKLEPFVAVNGPEPWKFTFDFALENCDQDHIEVTVKVSGGGGFVR